MIEDTPVREESKVIQCDLDESAYVPAPPPPPPAREKVSKSKSKRVGGSRGKKRRSCELEDVRVLIDALKCCDFN